WLFYRSCRKKVNWNCYFFIYFSCSIYHLGILASIGPGFTAFTFALTLLFCGIFFGGPIVIVAGVVSSDLGEDTSMKKDVRSISTITGIVNGSGSIAAAIIQVIIPLLKSVSFYVYFSLCLIAAILLTPTALKDFRKSRTSTITDLESRERE